MEMGFTSAVYVLAAVLFILSLGGLSGKKVQSAQFGMVLLVWLWLFPQPYLDQEMDYGGCRLY